MNFDSAAAQVIEISEDILARAKFWVEDGVTVGAEPPELAEMTLEERKAEDAAFLESLRCTPEMIAEQQAELDAAE